MRKNSSLLKKEERQNIVFQHLNNMELNEEAHNLDADSIAEIYSQSSYLKRQILFLGVKPGQETFWKKVAKYCVENGEISKIEDLNVKINLAKYFSRGIISFEEYEKYLHISKPFNIKKLKIDFKIMKQIILLSPECHSINDIFDNSINIDYSDTWFLQYLINRGNYFTDINDFYRNHTKSKGYFYIVFKIFLKILLKTFLKIRFYIYELVFPLVIILLIFSKFIDDI